MSRPFPVLLDPLFLGNLAFSYIGDEVSFFGYTILIGYERKSFLCNKRKFG